MKNALCVAVALTLVAGSAQATFKVETDPKAQRITRVSVPIQGGLAQVGSPKKAQPVVKGFAKEVSLVTALKQIVPNGWHAKRAGGLDVSQLVSWRGEGRAWTEVLHTLAKDNGFSATVNWEKNELTVAPATMKEAAPLAEITNRQRLVALAGSASAAQPQTPAPSSASASSRAILSANASAQPLGKPAEAAKPAPAPAKVWKLQTDLTLRENIEAWAKKAGYEVSWAAVNYPIAHPVTLTGELDAEGGPLHQLVEGYRTAEQPITVSFWSNNVIRVENASYKQLPLKDEAPNRRAMN